MSDNSSSISTREAAEALGCTARYIQKLIKNGKLSATRTDGGNYLIDKSEFYRVFPDAFVSKRTEANNSETYSSHVLEAEIRHLKEMLSEKNKQNEFLCEQLEAAHTEKSVLLNTLSSNQKLLEHQSLPKRKKFLRIF